MEDSSSVSLIREAWSCGDRLAQEGRHHEAVITLSKAKAALLAEKQTADARDSTPQKYVRLLDRLLKELSVTLDAELQLMYHNPCIALQLERPPTTLKALKVAYHKMARQFHPDRNNNQSTAEVFACIQNAYEMLAAKVRDEAATGSAAKFYPPTGGSSSRRKSSAQTSAAKSDKSNAAGKNAELLSPQTIQEAHQLSQEELLERLRSVGVNMSPQTRKQLLVQLYLEILRSDAKRAQKRRPQRPDSAPDATAAQPPKHTGAPAAHEQTNRDSGDRCWAATELAQKSFHQLQSIMRLRGIPTADCVEKLDMIERILRYCGSKEMLDEVRPVPPAHVHEPSFDEQAPGRAENFERTTQTEKLGSEFTSSSEEETNSPNHVDQIRASEQQLPTPPASRISPIRFGSPIHLGGYLVSEDEAESASSDDSDEEEEVEGQETDSISGSSGREQDFDFVSSSSASEDNSSRPDTNESQRSRFVQSLREASQNHSSPPDVTFGVLDGNDDPDMVRRVPQLSSEHARDIQEEVEFWASPRLPSEHQPPAQQSEAKGWFWGGSEPR